MSLNGRKLQYAKLHATLFVPGIKGAPGVNLKDSLFKAPGTMADLSMTKIEDGIHATFSGHEVFIPSAQIIVAVFEPSEK